MRCTASSVVLFLLLSLSACVPSLHALYTDKEVIFEPSLLGEWIDAKGDSKSTLTLAKADDKAYKLVFADEEEKLTFIAHLVKLEDKLFLDAKGDSSVDDHTSALPVHMFFFVPQTTPTLRIRAIDPGWLKGFIEKNPAAIRHEIVDKDVVLTASTKELQSFVLRHLNTRAAFTDPVDYVRKK